MGNATGRAESNEESAPIGSLSKKGGAPPNLQSDEDRHRASLERFEPFNGVPPSGKHYRKLSGRSLKTAKQAAAVASSGETNGEELIQYASSPSPESLRKAKALLATDASVWRYYRSAASPKKVTRHTALHAAVSCCNTDMVALLLRVGADPNYDPMGLSVPPLVGLLWSINDVDPNAASGVTRALLEAGADATLALFKVEGKDRSIFYRALSTPLRDAFLEYYDLKRVADSQDDEALEAEFLRENAVLGRINLESQLRTQKKALKHNIGIRGPKFGLGISRAGLLRDIRHTAKGDDAGQEHSQAGLLSDVRNYDGSGAEAPGFNSQTKAGKEPTVSHSTILQDALLEDDLDRVQRILDKSPLAWMEKDASGITALHLAAIEGVSLSVLDALLEEVVDVDYDPDRIGTPLYLLVHALSVEGIPWNENHREIAKRLLRSGANAAHRGPENNTVFFVALSTVLREDFLEYAGLQDASKGGFPDWKLEEEFLRARKSSSRISGGAELASAISRGDVPAAESALAASPNAWKFETLHVEYEAPSKLMSCLHLAADRGQTTIVRKILESGADPNFLTPTKRTPLFEAVLRQKVEVVELLLANGADPNHRCAAGYTPVFEILRDIEKMHTQNHKTPCHQWKMSADFLSIRGELVALGPPPGRKTVSNALALAETPVKQIISALKKAGADLDVFDNEAVDTALLRCIRNCDAQKASVLASGGSSLALPVDGHAIMWHLFSSADVQTVIWVLNSSGLDRSSIDELFGLRHDLVQLERTYLDMVTQPSARRWIQPYEHLEYLCTNVSETILTFRAQYAHGHGRKSGKWVTIQVVALSDLLKFTTLEKFLYNGEHPGVSSLMCYYLHRPVGDEVFVAAKTYAASSFASPSSLGCIFVRSSVDVPVPLASIQAGSESRLRSIFLQLLVATESTADADVNNEYISLTNCFLEQHGSNLCLNLTRGADWDNSLMAPEVFKAKVRLSERTSNRARGPHWTTKPSKTGAGGIIVEEPGCIPVSAYIFSAGSVLLKLLGVPMWSVPDQDRDEHWGEFVKGGVENFLKNAAFAVPPKMEDLLARIMLPEAAERLPLEAVLQHPWLGSCPIPLASASLALRAAQKEPQLPLRSTRFNIVGTARAGKTSFFKAMKGEKFDPLQASTRAGEAEEVRTATNEAEIGAELTQARVEGDCVWVEVVGGKDTDYEMALRQEAARRVGRMHQGKTPDAVVETFTEEPYPTESYLSSVGTNESAADVPSETIEDPITEAENTDTQALQMPEPDSGEYVQVTTDTPLGDDDGEFGAYHAEEDHAEQLEDLDLGPIELGEHDHLSLSVFDFGGQGIFQCMQNLFLSKFGVYAVAFNLEDFLRSSTRPYEDLNYWLRALHIYAPTCPVVILGTHKDTVMSSLASKKEHRSAPVSGQPSAGTYDDEFLQFCRQISQKVQERFTHELLGNVIDYVDPGSETTLVFHPLSSCNMDKDGNFSEDTIFPILRQKVKELAINDMTIDPVSGTQVPFVDQRLPVSWLKIADALSELSHDTKIMSILRADQDLVDERSVEDIAEAHGLFSACDGPEIRLEKIKLMLRRLHQIARVFYYEHGPRELRKKVLLDPQWLLDSFSRVCRDFDLHPLVLDVEAERNEPDSWEDLVERGILHRKLLPYLWGDSRYRFYEFLIAFLRQQALLVALDDTGDSFLVPHLVSDLRSFTPETDALTVFNTTAWDDDGLEFVGSSDVTDEEEADEEPLVVAYYEFPEWLPRGFYERVIVKMSERNVGSGWPSMEPGSAKVPSGTGHAVGLEKDPNKPSVIKVALLAINYRFNRDVQQVGPEYCVANLILQEIKDVISEVNELYYAGTLTWELWVLHAVSLSFVQARLVESLRSAELDVPHDDVQRFRDEREPIAAGSTPVVAAKVEMKDDTLSPAQLSFRDFLKESLLLSEACDKVAMYADKMQQRYRYISNLLQEFKDQKVSESDLVSVYDFDEAEAVLFLRHVRKVLEHQPHDAVHVNAWFDPLDCVAKEECESVHTTIMNSSCLGVTCHASPFPFLEECGNRIKRSRCKILHVAAHAAKDGCLKIPVDEDDLDEFADPEELADCWEACIKPCGHVVADPSRSLECIILNNCHGRTLALGLQGASVVFWDSKANEQAAKKFAKLFHKECATSSWNFLAAFEDACKTMSMRWDVNKDPDDYPSGKAKDSSSKRAKKVAGLLRYKAPDGVIYARENRQLIQVRETNQGAEVARRSEQQKVADDSVPPANTQLISEVSKTWTSSTDATPDAKSVAASLMYTFSACLPPLVRENPSIMNGLSFKRVSEMSIKSLDKPTRRRFASYSHAIQLGRLNAVKQQLQQTSGSASFMSMVSSILQSFRSELSAQQNSVLMLAGQGTNPEDVDLLGNRLVLCVRLDVTERPDTNLLGYKLLWHARPVLALHAGSAVRKVYDECVSQMQLSSGDANWLSSSSETEDEAFEAAMKVVLGDEALRFHQVRNVLPRREKEIRGILDFTRLLVGRLTAVHLSGEDDNQSSLVPAEWDIETVFQLLKVRALASPPGSPEGASLDEADIQTVYKFRNTVMHQRAVSEAELESLADAVQRIVSAVAVISPQLAEKVTKFEATLLATPSPAFVKDADFKDFCLQFNASVNAQLEDLQNLAKENLKLTKRNTTLAEENVALQRRALAIMDIDNEIRRCNEGLAWCSREMQRAVTEYSNALIQVDLTERDEWRIKIDAVAEKTQLLTEQKRTLEEKRQNV